MKHQTR